MNCFSYKLDKRDRDLWRDELAAPVAVDDEGDVLFVFRRGLEWLALPADVIVEVCAMPIVHSLPYVSPISMGIANLHGECMLCFSLDPLLGISSDVEAKWALLISVQEWRVVLAVDEVYGLDRGVLRKGPVSLTKDGCGCFLGTLTTKERVASCVDAQLLVAHFKEEVR